MRRVCILNIDLNHIICVSLPLILQSYFDRYLFPASYGKFCRRHCHIPVGQAESKRVLRLFFHITISPACHTVIGKFRQPVTVLIEGHRQLP